MDNFFGFFAGWTAYLVFLISVAVLMRLGFVKLSAWLIGALVAGYQTIHFLTWDPASVETSIGRVVGAFLYDGVSGGVLTATAVALLLATVIYSLRLPWRATPNSSSQK